ncbi:MAG: nickel pincer cofactor biosynthesis protein LarB [Deltaproteobacteria bacterium]|nr:nickel pincer cofactor biosynthesis protein LarB [Deltaproteobacteria bacterium]
MHEEKLLRILREVAEGRTTPDDALEHCRLAPLEDLLCGLKLDPHRKLRTGLGEVVFAPGKSDDQLCSAMRHLSRIGPALASRVSEVQALCLQKTFPQGAYWPEARLFALGRELPVNPPWPDEGKALVLSAGAADRPVALEAFGCMLFFGVEAGYIADVGVAGLHRLQPHLRALAGARLVVAVAGMEGALPGVVAGFVRCPVIAVPTSVGYGVGAGGHAALNAMLCSCVPGLAVVNIDSGFGAAAFAAKMLLRDGG